MRWRILFITVVLIATISADQQQSADIRRNYLIEVQEDVSDDSSSESESVLPDDSSTATESPPSSLASEEGTSTPLTTTPVYTNTIETSESSTSSSTSEQSNEGNRSSNEENTATGEEDLDSPENQQPPGSDSSDDNDDDVGASTDGTTESPEEYNKDLLVETLSGPVQGHVWQNNENIISYIDIPYGIFDNPFQVATAASTWETHEVKDHNKRCPQLDNGHYVGDLDCLTLSIFKPLNGENLGVLFHVHAENFNSGSGDPFIYGPEYLVSKDIILVLPNYRLGPLGFLCMQNETAPGNMALKDLSLALNWIHDNIEKFGGDPDNIGVSGDGKSGALAGLLALSPMSKRFVNKVIAESGSFLSHWALDRDPSAIAEELLDRIQEAEGARSRRDISLREIGVPAIVTAAKDLEFKPCVEINTAEAFMTETPYFTITNETFEGTSFLLGSAMYAGVHEALHLNEDNIKKLNEDFTLLLPNDLTFDTVSKRNEVGVLVKEKYFGEDDISLDDVKELSLCFTDIGYLGPGIRSARGLVSAGATVYFYEFAYVGALNRVLQSIDHPVEGAVRGDIVGYLFTQDGVVAPEQQSDENTMVEKLTTMWTNFLKTGVPTADSIDWKNLEETDYSEEEWLLIDLTPSLETGLHTDRLPFWTEIYKNHFIDNFSAALSPSVYIVLFLQFILWIGFCKNASHVF